MAVKHSAPPQGGTGELKGLSLERERRRAKISHEVRERRVLAGAEINKLVNSFK